jgi:hypothetical protein
MKKKQTGFNYFKSNHREEIHMHNLIRDLTLPMAEKAFQAINSKKAVLMSEKRHTMLDSGLTGKDGSHTPTSIPTPDKMGGNHIIFNN